MPGIGSRRPARRIGGAIVRESIPKPWSEGSNAMHKNEVVINSRAVANSRKPFREKSIVLLFYAMLLLPVVA
jgi:hypothetical protein